MVVEQAFWRQVLSAQEQVSLHSQDGDTWGVLARAYQQVAFDSKQFIRQDEVGQALYLRSVQAYEKATSLSPKVAKWHAGFAELLWHRLWPPLPDESDPVLVHALQELRTALDLDPSNAQAQALLEEIASIAPQAVVQVDGSYRMLLLTATLRPPTLTAMTTTSPGSPTAPPGQILTPPSRAQARPSPTTPPRASSRGPGCLAGPSAVLALLVLPVVLAARSARTTRP